MEIEYLAAIRELATDTEFRAEFQADADAALSRRRLRLTAEQLGALMEVVGGCDGEPPVLVKAIARPRGWWGFTAQSAPALGVG